MQILIFDFLLGNKLRILTQTHASESVVRWQALVEISGGVVQSSQLVVSLGFFFYITILFSIDFGFRFLLLLLENHLQPIYFRLHLLKLILHFFNNFARLCLLQLALGQQFKQLGASRLELHLLVLQELQCVHEILLRVFKAKFDRDGGVAHVVDDHAQEPLVALDLVLEELDLVAGEVTEVHDLLRIVSRGQRHACAAFVLGVVVFFLQQLSQRVLVFEIY